MKFLLEVDMNFEPATVRNLFNQAVAMMEGFSKQGVPAGAHLKDLFETRPDQPYIILTEAMAEGAVPGDPVCGRMLITRAPFDTTPLAVAQARKENSKLTVQNTRDGSVTKVDL